MWRLETNWCTHTRPPTHMQKVTMLARRSTPPQVVKYLEDESGNSNPLALPDPIVSYVTMSDVEPLVEA